MSTNVYLNGEYLPLEEAKISVMDRGFLFGDGVYEVIPVYNGVPFRLQEHLHRLDNSLNGIKMLNPHTHDEWISIFDSLIRQSDTTDQALYLQITRGSGTTRDHAIPENISPTVFAMTKPLIPPALETKRRGIKVITLDDTRWQLCQIKSITLLANVLARQQATEEDAQEAILIRDGAAVEGSSSNLFIVKDGLMMTPMKSNDLLPGVTRDFVLDLAGEAGIPYAEVRISAIDLENADEIWLTSSTKEIMPVVVLNGKTIGDGIPGKLWNHMNALYEAGKERLRLTQN